MATVTHTFVSGIADDPTAAAAGEVLPSHWNANHTVSGVRTILTANTNYYVTVTGSDANDGSLAHPWATTQHAANVISGTLDIAGFTITVNIGAGQFAGVLQPTYNGGGVVRWEGAGRTSTSLIQYATQAFCFDFAAEPGPTIVSINNLTLDGSVLVGGQTANGLISSGAFVQLYIGTFNGSGGSIGFKPGNNSINSGIITSEGQTVFFITTGSAVLDGSALSAPISGVGGSQGPIIVDFTAWTFSNTPQFATGIGGGFIALVWEGVYLGLGASYSGAFTGDFYDIYWGSFASFDFLPGTFAGNVDPTSKLTFTSGESQGWGGDGILQNAGAPTTTQLPAKLTQAVAKDTNFSGVPGLGLALYANDGGTIVEITRQKLTANTNFYVATTGNDSNPGSLASPWLTLQHAFNFIGSSIDIAGFTVTINVGAGSFAGAGTTGAVGAGSISVVGAGTASTTITAGPNDGVINFGECFDVQFNITPTLLFVDKLKMKPGNANYGIVNYQPGMSISFGTPASTACSIAFDLTNGPFALISNQALGLISTGFQGAIAVGAGTCTQAYDVIDGGFITNIQQTWTLTGTPSFGSFATVTDFSALIDNGTYTGAATGPRFVVATGSMIIDQNGLVGALGPNFYPGNSAGTCDPSSIYDGINGPLPSVNTQTGASYTLATADLFARTEMNNAGANTITVPLDSALVTGGIEKAEFKIIQTGAGATTVAAAGGVTVHNAGAVGGQWKAVALYWRGTNEWVQTNA